LAKVTISIHAVPAQAEVKLDSGLVHETDSRVGAFPAVRNIHVGITIMLRDTLIIENREPVYFSIDKVLRHLEFHSLIGSGDNLNSFSSLIIIDQGLVFSTDCTSRAPNTKRGNKVSTRVVTWQIRFTWIGVLWWLVFGWFGW